MKKTKSTAIAVVDDHALMRVGIIRSLEILGCHTTIEAEHGAAYLKDWENGARCQIAIVDLCMPVMDGWATIEHITAHQPGVLPIAITFDPNPGAVRRAYQAGARAVMSKTAGPEAWKQALHDVLTTGHHHNELTRMVLNNAPQPGSPEALRKKVHDEFTSCQLGFLMDYTAEDEPTLKELAERKGVELCTIESHRRKVVEKTGVNSRLALFRFTQDFGLR